MINSAQPWKAAPADVRQHSIPLRKRALQKAGRTDKNKTAHPPRKGRGMRMRKAAALLMAAALCFACFTGCTGKKQEEGLAAQVVMKSDRFEITGDVSILSFR